MTEEMVNRAMKWLVSGYPEGYKPPISAAIMRGALIAALDDEPRGGEPKP